MTARSSHDLFQHYFLGHTLIFPHSPAAASLLAALALSLSGSGINMAVEPYLISRFTSLCGF